MTEDRAYHDTYYVVAHFNYAISLLLVLIAVFAIWRVTIYRSPDGWPSRWRWPVIGAFLAGALMVLLPPVLMLRLDPADLMDRPWVFIWTNRLSFAGSVVSGLAALTTFAIFLLTLLHRPSR